MGERNTISSSFSVNTIEDGKDGMVYEIVSSVGSVTIPSDALTATLSATLSFYRRQGTGAREAYLCCYSVFRKNGTTYTKTRSVSTKSTTGSTGSMSLAAAGSGAANAADAVVVCIYDSYSESHSGYLAELEIPVRKNGDTGAAGEDGNDGEDAVYYWIETNTPVFHYDPENDEYTPDKINVVAHRTKGDTDSVLSWSDLSTYGLTLQFNDNNGMGWFSVTQSQYENLSGGQEEADSWFSGLVMEQWRLLQNGNVVATTGISVTADGETGPRGKTGPMSYLAGDYDATVNYGALLTDTSCPVVHFVNGTTDEYWYPTEDYRGAGYDPSVANGWKKAYDFEMVVTKILFTQFAKLGGFVVSGDYMLSQYGELIDVDGNRLTLTEQTDSDGFTHWRYNGVDAYTYFRDYDPMVTGYTPDPPLAVLHRNGANGSTKASASSWADWSVIGKTTVYSKANFGNDQTRANAIAVGDYFAIVGVDTSGGDHRIVFQCTENATYLSGKALYFDSEAEGQPMYYERRFRPVKVVNAATGEEWMSSGKVHVSADGDVTVEGTILAKNLYRNVCTFVDGGTYFNRNGERWFYNPTTGGYEKNPETTSGKVQCIYDADIVFMLGRGASGWQNDDPVFMPRAAAFQGKIIEFIIKCDTSGVGTIYIGAVGSSNSMGSNEIAMLTSAVPTGDKYNLQPIQTSNNCFVASPDTRVRFISMPDSYGVWKWVVVDETNI